MQEAITALCSFVTCLDCDRLYLCVHTGASGTSDGGSPVKIALFSLGNMCAHKECREALLALGVLEVMQKLSSNPDPTLQKYLQRIQTKLQQAGAVPSSAAAAR